MKHFLPLIITVVAAGSARSQPGPSPDKKPILTHDDSVVLAEVGAWLADSSLTPDPALRPEARMLDFPVVINAVLADFPNNLRHVAGELVLAQGEFEDYASLVMLPGASSCTVIRWHSWEDTTASWQAKMFNSDDFAAATAEYHSLFRKLQRCYLRLVDGSIIYLTGDWEPPKDGIPFTTSTLRLQTGDRRYKEVKVELELAYQLADWAVNINIVSKRRDDQVGGNRDQGDQ